MITPGRKGTDAGQQKADERSNCQVQSALTWESLLFPQCSALGGKYSLVEDMIDGLKKFCVRIIRELRS